MNIVEQIPEREVPQAERPALSFWRHLVQIVSRLLLSAALSGAVVWVAVVAVTITTAPRWVCLVVEPLSFFLVPGAVYAYVDAAYNKLDFSAATVVYVSFFFYFVCLAFVLLLRLERSEREGQADLTRAPSSR